MSDKNRKYKEVIVKCICGKEIRTNEKRIKNTKTSIHCSKECLVKDKNYINIISEAKIQYFKEHPDIYSGNNNPMHKKGGHSEETKKKISESRLKKIQSGKIVVWNKGKKLSENHADKLRNDFGYIRSIVELRGFELLSTEYKNNKQKLKVKCKKCGDIEFKNFNKISRNRGCINCRIDKQQQTLFKRYGVFHPAQNRDIALKAARNSNNSYILTHWKTGEEIVCKGTWEVKVVERWNDQKINFDWQIPFKIPNGRTYIVDAYLPDENKWVEIKGWLNRNTISKEKWDWFHKEYPNSELWNKEKLKELKIL